MNKSLAIAVLLGAVSAEIKPVDINAKKLEAIVIGALKGAIHAEGFDDITKCISDGNDVLKSAEKAVKDFERKSVSGTAAGLKDIADMLMDVKNGMADCSHIKADWI